MMMGVASLIISLAPAIGPAYGGAVLEAFGWHAMFLFAVPLITVAFVAGVVCLRQTTELAIRPFDATGVPSRCIWFSPNCGGGESTL